MNNVKKILIADDEPDILEILQFNLETEGFEVFIAKNGNEAIEAAKKHLPDGRNAHLIIESPDWWRTKILSNMQVSIVHEHVIVVDKSHKWPGIVGHNYDVVEQHHLYCVV